MRTSSKNDHSQVLADTVASRGVRRTRALQDLAQHAAHARSPEQACTLAAEVLADHAGDIPFALFYLVEEEGRTAKLAAAAGVPDGHDGALPVLALDGRTFWRFADVRARMRPVTIPKLGTVLAAVPPAAPPHTAVVLPITSTGRRALGGFLVAGVSPRTRLDAQYHDFFDDLAAQVAVAIDNARA
jgi:GAF domain-containing protein